MSAIRLVSVVTGVVTGFRLDLPISMLSWPVERFTAMGLLGFGGLRIVLDPDSDGSSPISNGRVVAHFGEGFSVGRCLCAWVGLLRGIVGRKRGMDIYRSPSGEPWPIGFQWSFVAELLSWGSVAGWLVLWAELGGPYGRCVLNLGFKVIGCTGVCLVHWISTCPW